MKHIWGRFHIFGQAMSGLMGFYIIYQIIVSVLKRATKMVGIHAEKGASWDMLAGLIPILDDCVLAKHRRKKRLKIGKVGKNSKNF